MLKRAAGWGAIVFEMIWKGVITSMKYQNIIDNMTLKEKAAFLSGKSEWQTRDFPRLDIPAIFCSDGPNGVRKQAGA